MKRWVNKFAPLGALLLIGSMAVSACGSDEPSASEGGTLRVAFTPGFGTLPVHLAVTEGIFEKNGLDVEVTEGLDLATYAGALDKQFDIVMTTAPIYLSAAEKLPLIAVAGAQVNVEDPPNNVLVTKDPSIKSVADLAGKRVGVPTLTGAASVGLQYLIKQADVDLDDVKLVQVEFGQHFDQLEAGSIDAVVSAVPFFTPLLANDYRIVVDTGYAAPMDATGAETNVNAFFIASEKFAEENGDVLEDFKKSISEGIESVSSDEPAARAELQKWLGMDAAIIEAAPIPGYDVELTAEMFEPWVVILKDMGIIEGDVDAEDLVWKS